MKVAVLVLHGIGNHSPDFADDMIDELKERLGEVAPHFIFQPCMWGGALDARQKKMADVMAPLVDKTRIRRELVLGGFGDLISYLGSPTGRSEYAEGIHKRVEDGLAHLEAKLRRDGENPETTPLVIMGHSLGCYVASNYLWDHQHSEGGTEAVARSPFTACDTMVQFITFGCNLPLTSLAIDELQVARPVGKSWEGCFTDQGADLYRASVKWLNFYDPDDILGFPLRPLGGGYEREVRDVEINTGGLLLAHTGYWCDNSMTKPVAARLHQLLAYRVAA